MFAKGKKPGKSFVRASSSTTDTNGKEYQPPPLFPVSNHFGQLRLLTIKAS